MPETSRQQSSLSLPAISPIKWTWELSKDDEIHLQDIEQIEED